VLPLIAQSMELPLFTRDIKGKAVERGPEYGSRTSSGEGSEVRGDETEDLYMLVKSIKVGHTLTILPSVLRVESKNMEGLMYRTHIRNVPP